VTAEQIIGLSLALLVMAVGLLGSVLPVLPGVPVVLGAAIAHKLYFGADGASGWLLVVLAFLTILALGLDYLATSVGARRLGASWRGMLGAVLGGLVGLFFSIPGILLGPFIGAFLLELAGGYEYRQAMRAGAGATLGLLAGALGKFAVCVVMITLFTANVLYHSLNS
jgi:uncharacterized protein